MRFAEEFVLPKGSTEHSITVEEAPNRSTALVNFLVIKSSSTYNAILGRLTFIALRAVT